jgi:hypothetical protein
MRCREDYAKKQAVKEFIPIEAIAEMALLWLQNTQRQLQGRLYFRRRLPNNILVWFLISLFG